MEDQRTFVTIHIWSYCNLIRRSKKLEVVSMKRKNLFSSLRDISFESFWNTWLTFASYIALLPRRLVKKSQNENANISLKFGLVPSHQWSQLMTSKLYIARNYITPYARCSLTNQPGLPDQMFLCQSMFGPINHSIFGI